MIPTFASTWERTSTGIDVRMRFRGSLAGSGRCVQAGAILECGGKRSATPLFIEGTSEARPRLTRVSAGRGADAASLRSLSSARQSGVALRWPCSLYEKSDIQIPPEFLWQISRFNGGGVRLAGASWRDARKVARGRGTPRTPGSGKVLEDSHLGRGAGNRRAVRPNVGVAPMEWVWAAGSPRPCRGAKALYVAFQGSRGIPRTPGYPPRIPPG